MAFFYGSEEGEADVWQWDVTDKMVSRLAVFLSGANPAQRKCFGLINMLISTIIKSMNSASTTTGSTTIIIIIISVSIIIRLFINSIGIVTRKTIRIIRRLIDFPDIFTQSVALEANCVQTLV